MAVESEPTACRGGLPGFSHAAPTHIVPQNDGGPVVEVRVVVLEAVNGRRAGSVDRRARFGEEVDANMDRSPFEAVFALDGERVRIVPAARLVVASHAHGGSDSAHVAEQQVGPAARVQVARGSQPPAADAQVEDGARTLG